MNDTWASILAGLLAYCGAMVMHAYFFGRRIGTSENETAANKRKIEDMAILVSRMKSVVEIYTGVSIDGIDVKPNRGGD